MTHRGGAGPVGEFAPDIDPLFGYQRSACLCMIGGQVRLRDRQCQQGVACHVGIACSAGSLRRQLNGASGSFHDRPMSKAPAVAATSTAFTGSSRVYEIAPLTNALA